MNNFLFTFPNLFHLHIAHLVLEMSIELRADLRAILCCHHSFFKYFFKIKHCSLTLHPARIIYKFFFCLVFVLLKYTAFSGRKRTCEKIRKAFEKYVLKNYKYQNVCVCDFLK